MTETKAINLLDIERDAESAAIMPLQIECMSTYSQDYNGKEVLEAVGVEFFDPIENDPTLQLVKLPVGWKIFSNNSQVMLLDEIGRNRADIYYKDTPFGNGQVAVFVRSRHYICTDVAENSKVVLVRAMKNKVSGSRMVYATTALATHGYRDALDAAKGQVETWLDCHYPDWRNPTAYWSY